MEENEKIVQLVADILGVEENEVVPDAVLGDDLGADSMDIFQILMAVEVEFGIEVDNEESEHVRTVDDIMQIIRDSQ